MTKTKTTEDSGEPQVAQYVALGDRNETAGFFPKGTVTDLAWLSDDAKGFVLFHGYYAPLSWELVPPEVYASYEEHR